MIFFCWSPLDSWSPSLNEVHNFWWFFFCSFGRFGCFAEGLQSVNFSFFDYSNGINYNCANAYELIPSFVRSPFRTFIIRSHPTLTSSYSSTHAYTHTHTHAYTPAKKSKFENEIIKIESEVFRFCCRLFSAKKWLKKHPEHFNMENGSCY